MSRPRFEGSTPECGCRVLPADKPAQPINSDMAIYLTTLPAARAM